VKLPFLIDTDTASDDAEKFYMSTRWATVPPFQLLQIPPTNLKWTYSFNPSGKPNIQTYAQISTPPCAFWPIHLSVGRVYLERTTTTS
jgi:hypothetical protein